MTVAVKHLKDGLSYRDLLAGLFLAGIRNIKPHPVGFKFHAVMVVNSAHLLGQTAAVDERLLPLFWALDTFKKSQAQDVKEGDWTLGKVDESRLPRPDKAKLEFLRAMDAWDAEAADASITALCRTSGAAETMEPLWRMAVRDQRNIGHKPIFAAQSWRTLQTIGWQHAEPVLRSLSLGLLDLHGDSRHVPVGPYEANLENAKKLGADWSLGKPDPSATRALLDAMRQASPEAASAEAVKLLNGGVSADSLWDAVILSASELLMRSPGIVALHATTSANSLHYIYGASGDDTTRKLALLQAVGWQPLYRGRPKDAAALSIDALEPLKPDAAGDDRRRRDLRDDQRQPLRRLPQGPRLPRARRLPRPAFLRRASYDLPQRPRQPRLQVRRRLLGGMRPRLRPQMARPPDRRLHVQPAWGEDEGQRLDDQGEGGREDVILN